MLSANGRERIGDNDAITDVHVLIDNAWVMRNKIAQHQTSITSTGSAGAGPSMTPPRTNTD